LNLLNLSLWLPPIPSFHSYFSNWEETIVFPMFSMVPELITFFHLRIILSTLFFGSSESARITTALYFTPHGDLVWLLRQGVGNSRIVCLEVRCSGPCDWKC
jgi:hypothetical protein